MALNVEFEVVRASLLHRDPLPFEKVISEVFFEDTRLATLRVQRSTIVIDSTIAAISSSSSSKKKTCNYCNKSKHIISECRKL